MPSIEGQRRRDCLAGRFLAIECILAGCPQRESFSRFRRVRQGLQGILVTAEFDLTGGQFRHDLPPD